MVSPSPQLARFSVGAYRSDESGHGWAEGCVWRIDSLGERWMRDVSGESSLRRGPRARPLTLARSHFPTLTHQRVSHIINQTRRKICCSKMQLVH